MTAYSDEIKQEILRLNKFGFSSRQIASELGISKSGVNKYLNSGEILSIDGPKILFLDLETAPAIVVAFNRFDVNLTQDHILKEGGYILTAAWSWLGSDTIYRIALDEDEVEAGDDSVIVAALYEQIEEADIIIAHNGIKFDFPVINARLLVNNFPPHKTVKKMDTLRMAKHFKFPSNKLDSIGAFLGLGRKVDTGGITLWTRILQGDMEAIDEMVEYNDRDVRLLKDVYRKLFAFNSATVNFGHYYDDDKLRCPACGSDDITPTGHSVYTPVSQFSEYSCGSCGHRSRSRSAVNSREKRKNTLVTPKVTG